MPRPSSELAAPSSGFRSRLAHVIAAARPEGRARALDEIRSLVGGAAPAKRGRPFGSKNKPKSDAAAKPKRKRRNSWAGLSPAARLKPVNAIRAGKGLPPRNE